MSRFLLIETSTERGVIACLQGNEVLFAKDLPFGSAQSRHLMPMLSEALKQSGLEASDLTGIGVGIGPGSYTGIRIGVAVAQALAYSWNLPLIGVSSLNGFIPDEKDVCFAAIIDAKIGGAYVRKGFQSSQGVRYLSGPLIYSLEEIGEYLMDVAVLVTPSSSALKAKLERIYPDRGWKWEEKPPSAAALGLSVQSAYQQGLWKKNGHLELLYLRETEAEREKNRRKAT